MDAATAGQHLKGACPLTAGEQQMLLAIHEAGHVRRARHRPGVRRDHHQPPITGSRDGRTDLKQLARGRTARTAAHSTRGRDAGARRMGRDRDLAGGRDRQQDEAPGRQTERLPRPDRRRGRPLQPDVLPHPAAHRLPARRGTAAGRLARRSDRDRAPEAGTDCNVRQPTAESDPACGDGDDDEGRQRGDHH